MFEYDESTRSGLTSTRHSTKLATADYPAAYGVDGAGAAGM